VFEEQEFHSSVPVLTHLEIVRWVFEEKRKRLDGGLDIKAVALKDMAEDQTGLFCAKGIKFDSVG
jgi:hypothetical protein